MRGGPAAALGSALGSTVGAGLWFGIAPAAAAAGPWLFPAVGLAALAACCAPADPPRTGLPGQVGALLAVLARTVGAAVVASAAGWYLTPARPLLGALVVLVVALLLALLGDRVRAVAAVGVPVLLVVLALVVLGCFAVAPAAPAVTPPPGVPGSADLFGLLAATGFAVFAFLGADRGAGARRVLLVLVLHVAVAAAVLRQLGGARLAVSTAPLRDALAAADAAALTPVLTIGVAVSAVLVLHGIGTSVRTEPGGARRAPAVQVVVLLVAAALAVLLARPGGALGTAMAAAACLGALAWAFGNAAARSYRALLVTAVLAVALLVALALAAAPVAAAVVAVTGAAVLLALVSARRARAAATPR